MELIQRSSREVSAAIGCMRAGRDEMNLVEFPLALLSDRARKGQTTLEFSDEISDKGVVKKREVVVTASPKHGLPTATDEDVLMGMLQLAKLQNEFTSPIVNFTRLQLIRLLGWENTKWSYDRLTLALYRWQTVSVNYTNAWRDNGEKQWRDQGGFGLIDSFNLRDSRKKNGRSEINDIESHSWFRWSGFLFDSFSAGYIKKLDYRVYQRLKRQAAKRLYRYLDKHFYEPHRLTLEFDLRNLACEHLGMNRSYDLAQIRRALEPAIRELEEIGFVEPMAPPTRYRTVIRGKWTVVLRKRTQKQASGRGIGGRQAKRETRFTGRTPEQQKVDSYIAGLSPEETKKVEHDALAIADKFLLRQYDEGKAAGGPLFETCRKLVIERHVQLLLQRKNAA